MKMSHAVVWLALLIAVLALAASGTGLFSQETGGAYSFTTLRGQTVQMYGQGLYRYDTLFQGAGNRGTDAVTLFLGIPLLLICTVLYRRGSLRGGLLLTGILAYFLYVYASLSLNTAYNDLFLVYVALFSASLFALILAMTSFDLAGLKLHFSERIPRRGPAIFMFVAGVVTALVWLSPLVAGYMAGEPPRLLDSYTTMVMYALDLAIIVPSTFICGGLVLRRESLGYLLAFPLLGIIVLLGPAIAAQTYSQVSAGVSFAPAEIIGPIVGFGVIALLAIWLLVGLLRNISESPRAAAALAESDVTASSTAAS